MGAWLTGARRGVLLVVVVLALFASVALAPLGAAGSPVRADTAPASGRTATLPGQDPVTSVELVSGIPSEAVAGTPITFLWMAVDRIGLNVPGFAVACGVTVTATDSGSAVPAWANTTLGPFVRVGGTFQIPVAAWEAFGELNVTITLATAVPVTVRLVGSQLPGTPAPVEFGVLPDRNHLVLYDPDYVRASAPNETYWHVRDRFGEPAPGATLLVVLSTGSGSTRSLVPVTWSNATATGAWVNYSAMADENATLLVEDGAGTALLGPTPIPAAASGTASNATTSSASGTLPPLALVAVGLVVLGAMVGLGVLLFGGRAKPDAPPTGPEEELRRLAEGRTTVVEMLRTRGALSLHEIENAWDPPPAPPAVADWVASLVTDGTLTATLGEGDRARFALADRPVAEPRVTLDEGELERGIARREAAVEDREEDAAAERTDEP